MQVSRMVDKLFALIGAIETDLYDDARSYVNVCFNGHNLHAHRDFSRYRGTFVVWRVDGVERETWTGIVEACMRPAGTDWRRAE